MIVRIGSGKAAAQNLPRRTIADPCSSVCPQGFILRVRCANHELGLHHSEAIGRHVRNLFRHNLHLDAAFNLGGGGRREVDRNNLVFIAHITALDGQVKCTVAIGRREVHRGSLLDFIGFVILRRTLNPDHPGKKSILEGGVLACR